MRILALLLVPALVAAAPVGGPRHRRHRIGPMDKAMAKAIAETETSGIAVSARRIRLNGATGGWEVDVHMPREDRGWRCIIDADTRQVHRRTRIENPPLKKRRK